MSHFRRNQRDPITTKSNMRITNDRYPAHNGRHSFVQRRNRSDHFCFLIYNQYLKECELTCRKTFTAADKKS